MVVRCKHDWNPSGTLTKRVWSAEYFRWSERSRGAFVVRCADFYKKWEHDPNWCEKCPEAVRLIESYMDLTRKMEADGVPKETTMVGLSERAARPLFAIRDEETKQKAISHIENALTRTTPQGGQYTKKLTAGDVQQIVKKAENEVRTTEPRRPAAMAIFNETNDNIEWARWSWNPVTGCKHDCVYCYARDIANRFFPEKFEPTFHPERLTAPANTKVPAAAVDNQALRNVFVCSMADLFGAWVPEEWIQAVLDACEAAPQWNFLFLTKNPERLAEFVFPVNSWVGTTVDTQARAGPAQKALARVNPGVGATFVSCEPLREEVIFPDPIAFDWLIVGGQSSSSKCPEFQPEWDWVEGLLWQARETGCNVYFKPNLKARPREYPGGDA